MEEDNIEMVEGDIVELETVEIAKHALVGKIISEKALNRKTVRDMIIKSWGNPRGTYIIDLSTNTFLFNFSEPATPRRIMAEAPWNILGSLLCLHRWTPEFTLHEIEFTHSLFWIQIHGVPLEGISKENARRIASKAGEVEEVEDPFVGYKLARGFMRARVCVNITQPLVTGVWIPRKDLPNTWAWIYYEKLQDFCFKCGRLGHGKKDCEEQEVKAQWNPEKPRYGPKLGVPPLKGLSSVVDGMSHREEHEGRIYAPRRESGGKEVGRSDGGCQSKKVVDETEAKKGEGGKEPAIEMDGRVAQIAGRGLVQKGWMARVGQKEGGSASMSELSTKIQPPIPAEGVGVTAEESGPSTGPIEVNRSMLTRVDLEEGKIRSGLGPSSLEDLDIEAEDIGLKQKVIIIDVLSPEKKKAEERGGGPLQLDMNIDAEQIKKARDVIAAKTFGPSNHTAGSSKEGMEMVIWGPREKAKPSQPLGYIVELPDDEDSEDDLQRRNMKMNNEGTALAESIWHSLNLKRLRGELDSGTDSKEQIEQIEEVQGTKGKKQRNMITWGDDAGSQVKMAMKTDFGESAEMAEEAGPSMPPQGP